MHPELLGLSEEEFIQWAIRHCAVDERKLRKAYGDIEVFCARHPIGVGEFIENIVDRINGGCGLNHAIKCTKDCASDV